MKKQFLLILALASTTTLLSAPSPPPSPTPTPSTQTKQSASGIENHPAQDTASQTAAPKSTVDQASPPPTEKAAEAESTQNSDASAINWRRINVIVLTVFNGILVGVGILQWLSMRKQATHMRDGLIETRRAADAANASANAAQDIIKTSHVTERAIVLLESIAINTGQQLERASVIIVTLRNYGRTVASTAQLSGGFTFGEYRRMIDAKEISIPPQGISEWISPSMAYWMPPKEMAKINAQEAPLFYEIGVTYKDAFDKHEYVSRGKWNAALKRFIIEESVTT